MDQEHSVKVAATRRLRLTLDAWRRLVGQIDPARARFHWRTRVSYQLGGAFHSLLLQIQEHSHADALKAVNPQPPIFLLGFWRSGTTFLHELFCCDPTFGFPSTHACLNPSHFLLSERWISERVAQEKSQRPMDNMRYSWTSPQEDEFALLALGAPSVYEALIVPSLMRQPGRLLDLRQRTQEEQDRWRATFCYFVRLLTVQQGKPMVLKSPPHGFKLPFLTSLFPDARYVIIERNPYEVFASNLKLWRTLIDMYSLEVTSPEEIETFVLSAYVMHEEALAEGDQKVDPRSITRVRYEDLVADPVGQMARIYDELQLGSFATVQPRLEKYTADASHHTRNRFQLPRTQKNRIDGAWGQVIERKGYDWSNYISLC